MRLLATICAALVAAGCYDSGFTERRPEGDPPAVNATIGDLVRRFEGPGITVEGDIVVRGRVTANDRGGNFYRMLTIEDEGAGMEIRAAVDRLDIDFPVGCSATLRLRGLTLGREYGVLQAGARPLAGSGFAVGYIPSKAALDAALTRDSERLAPLNPTLLRLDELTPARCGALVRIEGLRYTPEELAPGTWSGEKRFTDGAGSEIYTYTSPYADFAGEEPPAGRCALTGILQYDERGAGHYRLKLRDAADCEK